MSKEVRTSGFDRKSYLPINKPGNPKVCRKCKLWFLAGPRQINCNDCVPAWKRSRRAGDPITRRNAKSEANALLTRTERVAVGLLSYGCYKPLEPQAEILSSDQVRRHPHDGRRPRWSGYCVLATCDCTCHGEKPAKALSALQGLDIPKRIETERGPSLYSYADRKRAVEAALKMARDSAPFPELTTYIEDLVVYARSTARGVVPGEIWQLTHLGHRVTPCNGSKAPMLLPHPDSIETEVAA